MQERAVSAIAQPFLVFLLAATSVTLPSLVHPGDSTPFQFAQGFSSWRPYANPNRLISVGMNKGEVLAIAGAPNHEESYYQSAGGRLARVSDWYYPDRLEPGDNSAQVCARKPSQYQVDADTLTLVNLIVPFMRSPSSIRA